MYVFNNIHNARENGVHIDENTPGEKTAGATRYRDVEKDLTDCDKACAITIAALAVLCTLGIVLIFSPELRAKLFGREVVTVDVKDPKKPPAPTTGKTNYVADNTLLRPATRSISAMPYQELREHFVDRFGMLRFDTFFRLAPEDMLALRRQLPRTPISFTPAQIKLTLNKLPLESLTTTEFSYFFAQTNFLNHATKDHITKLMRYIHPILAEKISDTTFQSLDITDSNINKLLNYGAIRRLSTTQIKNAFTLLTPHFTWLTLSQIKQIDQQRTLFTKGEIETLKSKNIYARSFFERFNPHQPEKPVFEFTLKVDKPPTIEKLKVFYNKFKNAEMDKQWHKVLDLEENYTEQELKAARKKMVIQLHSDQQHTYKEADKLMAAFNALYTHLLKLLEK